MSRSSVRRKTSETVRWLVGTADVPIGRWDAQKKMTMAWFPIYSGFTTHIIRQRLEEKYKGLQHD